MPKLPPKVDQGTLIILDIGKNVSEVDEKTQKSFFDEARELTSRLIERKIMSKGRNCLGVLLLGAKKTNNNMATLCPGAFRRIDLHAELQSPTWELVENLPDKCSNSQGDWLESIVVAADHFKNIAGVKIDVKKIVLITNFSVPTALETNDIEQVLNGLQEDNFELDVIGPDILDEKNSKNTDFKLVRRFVEGTNGDTAQLRDAMSFLLFHRKKITHPMPWNVDLSIGPNLKIPVSAYIKLKDEPPVKRWNKRLKDPITLKASSSEGIMKDTVHINTENQTVVEATEVIKGYNYGQQIIPFDGPDKNMLYKSGDKCLSVYGFTHASNISWQNLSGDGLSYVFGKKGDGKAQRAIQSLAKCLHELNLVGIARRVYNNNNAPKMFVLMPVLDANVICLSMTALCFKEEIKMMSFPPTSLKKYNCTDAQVNAFKDLIKAMDLMKAYDDSFDDTEAFPIAETVSPSVQYMLDCIAFRARNPDKPVPPPRDEIMTLFKQPPLIEERSRGPLEKIKSLFVLNKVESKTRSRNKNEATADDADNLKPSNEPTTSNHNQSNGDADLPKITLPKRSDEITRIGTVNPMDDYKLLAGKGKAPSELASQMINALEHLIYYNIDGNYSKALNAMQFFRTECVNGDPSFYNNWLPKFKMDLSSRNKDNVLALMNEKQLGVILKAENNLSTFENENSHEDSQLYENDTIPNSVELSLKSDVDMFDDM